MNQKTKLTPVQQLLAQTQVALPTLRKKNLLVGGQPTEESLAELIKQTRKLTRLANRELTTLRNQRIAKLEATVNASLADSDWPTAAEALATIRSLNRKHASLAGNQTLLHNGIQHLLARLVNPTVTDTTLRLGLQTFAVAGYTNQPTLTLTDATSTPVDGNLVDGYQVVRENAPYTLTIALAAEGTLPAVTASRVVEADIFPEEAPDLSAELVAAIEQGLTDKAWSGVATGIVGLRQLDANHAGLSDFERRLREGIEAEVRANTVLAMGEGVLKITGADYRPSGYSLVAEIVFALTDKASQIIEGQGADNEYRFPVTRDNAPYVLSATLEATVNMPAVMVTWQIGEELFPAPVAEIVAETPSDTPVATNAG